MRIISGAIWTALHGLTVLHLNGRLKTMGLDDSPEELIHSYLGLQFPGLTKS